MLVESRARDFEAPAPPVTQVSEDALEYLPISTILEIEKGRPIFHDDEPPRIYLVVAGLVKVCRLSPDGREVILDFYRSDDIFGESAFFGQAQRGESAVALDGKTRLMTWTIAEIEHLATVRPKLAIAFVQLLVQRAIDFGTRIESFSVDNIARRLARALIALSEKLGTRAEDGAIGMFPFTHELLSEYIGTSRDLVSQHMNQFRRHGYLRYSRKGIFVYCDALKTAILENRNASGAPDQDADRRDRIIRQFADSTADFPVGAESSRSENLVESRV